MSSMPNFLSFFPKNVEAKGLQKVPISRDKLQNFMFDDDFDNLHLIEKINLDNFEQPTLFYPACGSDIIFPLLYLERINCRKAKMILVDQDNNLPIIKTILDELGVSFTKNLNFYWNDLLVELQFIVADVFNMALPQFDIYFERQFRIMKDYHPDYENKIFQKLKQNGIIISDSGFDNFPLQNISVDKGLSSYSEMIIGKKIN